MCFLTTVLTLSPVLSGQHLCQAPREGLAASIHRPGAMQTACCDGWRSEKLCRSALNHCSKRRWAPVLGRRVHGCSCGSSSHVSPQLQPLSPG